MTRRGLFRILAGTLAIRFLPKKYHENPTFFACFGDERIPPQLTHEELMMRYAKLSTANMEREGAVVGITLE